MFNIFKKKAIKTIKVGPYDEVLEGLLKTQESIIRIVSDQQEQIALLQKSVKTLQDLAKGNG